MSSSMSCADRWENICSRCGMCCHEKVIYGDELIYDMDSACEFLDVLTNFCMVYPARFRKCPRCRKMTLWKAMMAAWLPESCAYVQWARRHHIRLASRLRLVIAEDGFCKAVLPDEDEGESENV